MAIDSNFWLTLIAALSLPLAGILTAIITSRQAKHNTNATATVSEKEAHTKEVTVIIDGLIESLSSMRIDLKDTREELIAERRKREVLEEKYERLARRMEISEGQRADMLTHMLQLEELIPTPPGPPERPEWLVRKI